ncbi:hypothetical protein FRB97_002678, partial [Tulasnella sp. 331]
MAPSASPSSAAKPLMLGLEKILTYPTTIALCRAFITSQSAEAHKYLFTKIFEIVKQDTGRDMEFAHIHGRGSEVWTMDEHKGQALGFGMSLAQLSQNVVGYDAWQVHRLVCSLTAYEHLERCFRLCEIHFHRNIVKIKSYLSPEVMKAMRSIATTEAHPDFEKTLDLIRHGGPKARNWLYDKTTGSPFAIPALYQPRSKISLEDWRASRSSSNGVEQKHMDVNRNGKGLTLLGGVMHGFQYDAQALDAIKEHIETQVHRRHQPADHQKRAVQSVLRNVRAGSRMVESVDRKISTSIEKTSRIEEQIFQAGQRNKTGNITKAARKRLDNLCNQLEQEERERRLLVTNGSGVFSAAMALDADAG